MTIAQANSAQREPSMEEILASIRRIIEDSDTARQQADDAAVVSSEQPADKEAFAADERPASAQRGSVIEVETFRADLRAGAQAQQPKPDKAPLSLADIQSEVKAGADVEEPMVSAEPKSQTPAAEAGSYESSDLDRAFEAAVNHAGMESDAGLDQDEMIAELSEQLGAMKTTEANENSASESRPVIVSEQTGRQVAAAFGELSEAFSSSRRRSFDEMAEEMIRPMLQDWLDNNLPVLVERLVREEIERVARGAGG